MKTKIRYRLYGFHPLKKKWTKFEQSTTLKGLGKKIAFNLQMNMEWYFFEGKQVKLRLVCEEVKGKEVKELEEYKITKGWKVKGYFWDWEKMDK